LIHHSHHVTRDADADASREAHAIENRIRRCRTVFEITGCVAGVSF
jgi:hypothetical protein